MNACIRVGDACTNFGCAGAVVGMGASCSRGKTYRKRVSAVQTSTSPSLSIADLNWLRSRTPVSATRSSGDVRSAAEIEEYLRNAPPYVSPANIDFEVKP